MLGIGPLVVREVLIYTRVAVAVAVGRVCCRVVCERLSAFYHYHGTRVYEYTIDQSWCGSVSTNIEGD